MKKSALFGSSPSAPKIQASKCSQTGDLHLMLPGLLCQAECATEGVGGDKPPKITLNSTGNYLVTVEETILPHRSHQNPTYNSLLMRELNHHIWETQEGMHDFHRDGDVYADTCFNFLTGSEVLPP